MITNGHIDHPTRRRPHRDARRIYLLGGILLLSLGVVAVRLVKIQLIDAEKYAEQARRQYESRVALQAERGALYDRNGHLLATNTHSLSFAVDPAHVEHPKKLAITFSRALGDSYDHWYEKITSEGKSFVWLKRKVSGSALAALKDIEDNGLIKLREPLRHFEYASLGSQVIGCTDIDNNGLNGVELYYNPQLRGSDGYMVMQRDARGRRRPDVDLPRLKPEHGDGLVLTLDINVQGIVEDELRKGIERAGAEGGTAIAIDPKSGEILAMASYPTYDPNDLRDATNATIRVRAITDMYEPGSTMKLVTAAAALEEGVVTPEEKIDAEGGTYQLGSHIIRDAHPGGLITFRQATDQSSNVVYAKIASRVATPRFYKYVRDFGFGIVSGVDLPGEARGEVKKPAEFTEGTQEFMAFGYQLAVTPLQLACAYAAVANGGVMMKPHLLKRRLDRDGNIIEEIEPQQVRRVISQTTADTLRELLVGVVEKGTGDEARIDGLRIAGKTGTAQQIDGGEYSKKKYNASFVGFFPADDPRITLLVLLDSPTNGYYGGQVAAPIFREIARRIAGASSPHQVAPAYASNDQPAVERVAFPSTLHIPDLRGLEPGAAQRIAERYGYRVVIEGRGKSVIDQSPDPGDATASRSLVRLMTSTPEAITQMPDVRGMSLRRALNILAACRLHPRISGDGLVRSQSPQPGERISSAARVVSLGCRQ